MKCKHHILTYLRKYIIPYACVMVSRWNVISLRYVSFQTILVGTYEVLSIGVQTMPHGTYETLDIGIEVVGKPWIHD